MDIFIFVVEQRQDSMTPIGFLDYLFIPRLPIPVSYPFISSIAQKYLLAGKISSCRVK
jgi:hypothetical protein